MFAKKLTVTEVRLQACNLSNLHLQFILFIIASLQICRIFANSYLQHTFVATVSEKHYAYFYHKARYD